MYITLSPHYHAKGKGFTYAFDDVSELFSVAKELQFDGVDYIASLTDIAKKPQRALALSKEYNVPILGVHAPMHLLLTTPSFLYKPLLNMYQNFPDAKIFNFHLSGFITPIQQNGNNVERFVKSAKEKKVMLSFESNPLLNGLQFYPKVTWDPDTFAMYCVERNYPITFDTSHIAHCNYDIVTFFKKYHKQIKLIHLSDSNGREQHLPLGRGNQPIKELLQEMKKVSYTGIIAFEICNFAKGATRSEKIAELQRSLAIVRKYTPNTS